MTMKRNPLKCKHCGNERFRVFQESPEGVGYAGGLGDTEFDGVLVLKCLCGVETLISFTVSGLIVNGFIEGGPILV